MPDAESTGSRQSFRTSLQTKIGIFVFLCVVVPLLGMGFYLLQRNQEVLGSAVRENLSSHLFRKSRQIDDWFHERAREAHSWAISFIIYEGIEAQSRPGPASERARRDLELYLESILGHYPVYESLFVVDMKGRVIASTRPEGLEEGDVPADADVASAVLTPLHRSARLNAPTLLVLQGVQGRTESVVGRFVERVNPAEIEKLLRSEAESGSLKFWLLDRGGRILATDGHLAEHPGQDLFPGFAVNPGGVGDIHEADLAGLGQTVYGLRALEGPGGGYLAVTEPAAVAFRSLKDSTTRLLTWGTVAILLLVGLNLLAARSMLRPIRLLSEGAKRVSAGDLDVYLPVRDQDEIGDLTRSFNDMARHLRDSRQSLEQARDELARTNDDLTSANRTLEALAITDGLTGLYNHRHFQETLDKEMRRCDREERSMSLLLMDIDHFKQYNDRHGHTEGDAALRRVAGQIMKSIRSTDMAFRYGGEEFAVLLPSCSKTQAAEVAEKIRLSVETAPLRPSRSGARNTVSVGVATFPEDARVARGLVDVADAALYSAKDHGRNRVVVAGATAAQERTAG